MRRLAPWTGRAPSVGRVLWSLRRWKACLPARRAAGWWQTSSWCMPPPGTTEARPRACLWEQRTRVRLSGALGAFACSWQARADCGRGCCTRCRHACGGPHSGASNLSCWLPAGERAAAHALQASGPGLSIQRSKRGVGEVSGPLLCCFQGGFIRTMPKCCTRSPSCAHYSALP